MSAPESNQVRIAESAIISQSAIIQPSQRGSRLVIGSGSEILDQAIIRFVGGSGDIIIGENCYINPGCVLYSGNGIRLGDYVLLAPGVKVMPTNHAYSSRDIPIRKQGFIASKGGVVAEGDNWVGANAVLLDGTVLEKGAIIAAGAVVSGKVPAFEIWGGVPARKIAER